MIWRFDYRKLTVVRCRYGCSNEDHEHFSGTYEKALEYFMGGVEESDGSRYKNLKDIVIFHQLSENTLTKTSAELYSILISAASKKEYWVEPHRRHDVVMDVLEDSRRTHLIKDDEILEKARSKEGSNKRMMSRLYRQEKWKEMIKYN